MSKHRIAICVALWLLASAAPVLADTVVNFASYGGNGITFNKASGGSPSTSAISLSRPSVTRRTMRS